MIDARHLLPLLFVLFVLFPLFLKDVVSLIRLVVCVSMIYIMGLYHDVLNPHTQSYIYCNMIINNMSRAPLWWPCLPDESVYWML